MTQNARLEDPGSQEVAFEVYGTRARVAVPTRDLVQRVVEQFPLHAVRCEPGPGDRRFALALADDGGYAVVDEEVVPAVIPELDNALDYLRYRLFYYAVHHARDHLVVSAAAVGHQGRAIILPGRPRVGKTMLVVELVRAGAEYYADDWAVLDREGLLHPYPTRLFTKHDEKVSVESLGGVRGERPIPVGLIASITYREGARWDPRYRTQAEGMMTLVGTAYGMDEPRFAMEAARRAASDAIVIEGERDDASTAASALLDIISRKEAQPPP